MSKTKRVLSLLTRMVLCFLSCALLWNFVLNLLTDAPDRAKVTLYVDIESDALRSRELSFALEEKKPSSLRMVRCHAFSYLMLGGADLVRGDLFILPESAAPEFMDSFRSLPEEMLSLGDPYLVNGTAMGIRVWDHALQRGCAAEYIGYTSSEDWYLFCGSASLHLPSPDGGGDNAACAVAKVLLGMN